MGTSSPPNITQLLVTWNQGDQDALAKLRPLVYRELNCKASVVMQGSVSTTRRDRCMEQVGLFQQLSDTA